MLSALLHCSITAAKGLSHRLARDDASSELQGLLQLINLLVFDDLSSEQQVQESRPLRAKRAMAGKLPSPPGANSCFGQLLAAVVEAFPSGETPSPRYGGLQLTECGKRTLLSSRTEFRLPPLTEFLRPQELS